MNQEVPYYVSLIVSWLPLLSCFAALYLFVARPLRRCLFTKDGRSLADVVAELADELKRRNDKLG